MSTEVPQKVKKQNYLYDPATILPGMYPEKFKPYPQANEVTNQKGISVSMYFQPFYKSQDITTDVWVHYEHVNSTYTCTHSNTHNIIQP